MTLIEVIAAIVLAALGVIAVSLAVLGIIWFVFFLVITKIVTRK